MNDGELIGKHYATGQTIRLQWQRDVISHLEPTESPRGLPVWIAPSLFDLQINGYSGVDFQQDNLSADDLLHATRELRQGGCGRYLLTLITDEWSKLITRLRHVRTLRSQSSELQAAIVGWHIEGPFLSAEPGFHGAHNPALMRDPTPADILELRAITGNDPMLLTLSPERAGAIEAIATAVSNGIEISLGHTNASAEILRQAVEAGASGFTHLGNGCPRELDRHDNILWRVFEIEGLSVSLIPDRIHVSPPLFRLVHRVLGPDRIYYTTDAMSAAGAVPGRYRLGKLDLEVGADQVVRQPGKTLFAGSALRPIEGISRAAEILGCSWREVWPRFSTAPAKLMGLKNELAVGQRADFCAFEVMEERQLLNLKIHAGSGLQS